MDLEEQSLFFSIPIYFGSNWSMLSFFVFFSLAWMHCDCIYAESLSTAKKFSAWNHQLYSFYYNGKYSLLSLFSSYYEKIVSVLNVSWIKIFVEYSKISNFIEDVYPVFVWTVILECYIWKFDFTVWKDVCFIDESDSNIKTRFQVFFVFSINKSMVETYPLAPPFYTKIKF